MPASKAEKSNCYKREKQSTADITCLFAIPRDTAKAQQDSLSAVSCSRIAMTARMSQIFNRFGN
jgi:hypothetical protein